MSYGYFGNKKYDEYGNRIEHIRKDEFGQLIKLKNKNLLKLEQIKKSNKCFGDKVRDVMKQGITQNTVHARKLLEMI
jgi:hypothetical protein